MGKMRRANFFHSPLSKGKKICADSKHSCITDAKRPGYMNTAKGKPRSPYFSSADKGTSKSLRDFASGTL